MGGGPWRLRSIPDPAQEAEGSFAQGWAAEKGRADDREHHYHLDDGDNLSEHGMQNPDADGSRQRGDAGAQRPPGRAFLCGRRRRTCLAAGATGIRLTHRMNVGDEDGLVDVPVGDREIVARHARAPLRGSAPVPNSGRLRRGIPQNRSLAGSIRLLALREGPSHTFTQRGCAFFNFAGRCYRTRLPLLGSPRRRLGREDALTPEAPQMLGEPRDASSSVSRK